MFGTMHVELHRDLGSVFGLADSLEAAERILLEDTEHPLIADAYQLPKALVAFLVMPDDPESGAVYVFDRVSRCWWSIDFDDDKFGGYSVEDFQKLIHECHFLDLVERPWLLTQDPSWVIVPGAKPYRIAPEPHESTGAPA